MAEAGRGGGVGLNEESKQLPGTSVTSTVALTVFSGGIAFPLGLHPEFVWTRLGRGIIKQTAKKDLISQALEKMKAAFL